MQPWKSADLDPIPRLGWVVHEPPVTTEPELAGELGLGWLGLYRDDLIDSWHGGTKQRKLDYLLATPELAKAPKWASLGGIGSGHLAALVGAAARLDRQVEALCIWQQPTDSVLSNLAYTTSGPSRVRYFRHVAALALRHPGSVWGRSTAGGFVVPPGATSAVGMLGLVRAALALCERVQAGEVPEPDYVVVARGTGGTAAGLALGLALGGLSSRVLAVDVVPAIVATDRRLMGWVRSVHEAVCAGTGRSSSMPEVRLDAVRGYLGRGYGDVTDAAAAACARLEVQLEPVYTGKAMAALIDPSSGWSGKRVLFWQTHHGELPTPPPDWRDKLPPALRRDLRTGPPSRTRRALLIGGAAALVLTVGGVARTTGYPEVPGWRGLVFAAWEAAVVMAAVEALIPTSPGAGLPEGPSARQVVDNVDSYLASMPSSMLMEIHALVSLVEHGTAVGGSLLRFTRLAPADRVAALHGLRDGGIQLAQVFRGLRDLCYLGWYQEPSTWQGIGYEGPRLPPAGGPTYRELVAPTGAPA